MYKNIGKKIMGLAIVLGWLGFLAGVIVAVTYFTNSFSKDDFIGWISLAAGIVFLILSLPAYGFGQLVDDVHTMSNQSAVPAVPNDELPEL